MKKLITLSLLIILFTASCKKERLTADGNFTTETRSPGIFTKVTASGTNNVHIKYGADYKVELKGSANLIPYYKTNIVNGRLYLSYENVNVRQDDIEVFITMPSLTAATLSGSATLAINGNFPHLDFLNFDISGSGDIVAQSNLTVQEISINISGSGRADAEKINSKEADVTISGSGDARISVADKLKASISGSGKVYYNGNATVTSHISGSGKVIKL